MSGMLPRPEPRDAFKRALRSQLMSQAATTLVGRETTWSRFQRLFMRPAIALAAVVLLLTGGAGKAAADSLPGDAVFPLKRAVEQVQLAFAVDDTTRLRILAEHADHRLIELAESIGTHRVTTTPIARAEYAHAIAALTKLVDAVRAEPTASEDKRTAAEDVVDAAHLKHRAVLEQLAERVKNGDDDEQRDIDEAKGESEKLHASDKPARSAEPTDTSERTRTPQPTKTATPNRTPEPTRSAQPSLRR
ncbi:MAG: DUF5667 domain-containing protein [Chloroflexota bacterium]